MDKIWLLLTAVGIGIGALFIPRIARGDTADTVTESSPGRSDIAPPPGGISPKGIRNNNPFNLEFRPDINWRGQVGTDGRFAVFNTSLNGIRAGMINVHTQITRNGFNTVRSLINRLSPAFENPTENFVAFVAQRVGVSPEQPLDFSRDIIPLSKAIITFENGENPYPDSLLRQALQETGRV